MLGRRYVALEDVVLTKLKELREYIDKTKQIEKLAPSKSLTKELVGRIVSESKREVDAIERELAELMNCPHIVEIKCSISWLSYHLANCFPNGSQRLILHVRLDNGKHIREAISQRSDIRSVLRRALLRAHSQYEEDTTNV